MKLFIFRLRVSYSKCDVILRNSVSQLDFVTREFRTSKVVKVVKYFIKVIITLNRFQESYDMKYFKEMKCLKSLQKAL